MRKAKKILKVIGITILLLFMAHASNWDLPPESNTDRERSLQDEIKAYEEARSASYYVIIGDDVYEGAYVDGMWYEPAEIYQEVVDAYLRDKP